eukprot:m.107398 g.107398  ORF g.107398 m.107398 type:complete len:408 (-) comp15840_c2_seq2:214-1437(-)
MRVDAFQPAPSQQQQQQQQQQRQRQRQQQQQQQRHGHHRPAAHPHRLIGNPYRPDDDVMTPASTASAAAAGWQSNFDYPEYNMPYYGQDNLPDSNTSPTPTPASSAAAAARRSASSSLSASASASASLLNSGRRVRSRQAGGEGDGYNSDDELQPRELFLPPPTARRFEDDAAFERGLLESKGWRIEQTYPDGACMFRAIAFNIYGDQEMHNQVRQMCMNYMEANQDHFAEFVAENFRAYIQRKRQPTEYGNHVELQALSEMYNRTIEVYSYSDEPLNIFQAANTCEPPIRLSYHANIHYNAIVDPARPAFGVGLGHRELMHGADRTQIREVLSAAETAQTEKALVDNVRQLTELEATEEALEQAILEESCREYMRLQQQQKLQQQKQQEEEGSASASAANEPDEGQ